MQVTQLRTKFLNGLLLIFSLNAASCASDNPKEEPHYTYVIMYGGKVKRFTETFPYENIFVDPKEIIGALCLKPQDWQNREQYLEKLRRQW